ncbi:anthranilate phosphoribosyltransferase [Shouchella clausii]|uniref:anthranilate phosphoribosyltransferase n=1 Tax=Shouchella clausii TaxID=79880 RepID=UPI0026FA06FD|nr:anthranilate phosphoribosyltransferase [Shouchella clausii]MDO7268297.1 anthranilate phosphoribosyltransferase [Shouchella clausii]MDO7288177.1 anthranilate phosphoribosyltransferase [Shouchella clausii]
MMKHVLNKCLMGESLSVQEAEQVMEQIMSGRATASQVASLITMMRVRGETAEEILGFAKGMRAYARKFPAVIEGTIDTCGTGGDGLGTFNISTASALVLASLGVPVAKHGNRSVSSKSGSADVLEELGINIQASVEEACQMLETTNLCFLFAPLYHQSMRHVAGPRKEIGFRTIFNLLGPLTNPAGARYQLLGVYDEAAALKMGEALRQLDSEHSLLVTGADGLDECAIHGDTHVVEVKDGKCETYRFSPDDVGLPLGNLADIQVDTPAESAALIRAIISGDGPQAAKNIVALNAGAALYACGNASHIAEGVHYASKAIESKRVFRYLQSLQQQGRGIKHA